MHNKLWKIFIEMGISDHLTCLLRTLYAGQEEMLEPDMEKQTGSILGKENAKVLYCLPAYLNYMQSTSREMPDWMKHKLESKLQREMSITSDMQITPPLMAESEEKLKTLLTKVKEESENIALELNIQKTKIMASSPITSWQIDGETMETVADFIFFELQITADGDCNHEIKRSQLLGRKGMTKLQSILKHREITLLTKAHLVKAIVFPVVMYGFESWTIKKAEH